MRRISHDLPGVIQRIARSADEFDLLVSETRDRWRDEKGRAFLQQHASEVRPTLAQLVGTMTKVTEIFEDISKKLQDPDRA